MRGPGPVRGLEVDESQLCPARDSRGGLETDALGQASYQRDRRAAVEGGGVGGAGEMKTCAKSIRWAERAKHRETH